MCVCVKEVTIRRIAEKKKKCTATTTTTTNNNDDDGKNDMYINVQQMKCNII